MNASTSFNTMVFRWLYLFWCAYLTLLTVRFFSTKLASIKTFKISSLPFLRSSFLQHWGQQ